MLYHTTCCLASKWATHPTCWKSLLHYIKVISKEFGPTLADFKLRCCNIWQALCIFVSLFWFFFDVAFVWGIHLKLAVDKATITKNEVFIKLQRPTSYHLSVLLSDVILFQKGSRISSKHCIISKLATLFTTSIHSSAFL